MGYLKFLTHGDIDKSKDGVCRKMGSCINVKMRANFSVYSIYPPLGINIKI